jgi:hypothetical protein
MNGDGRGDVVMVDAANNQMIIFKNKGQGVLGGSNETDVDFQPQFILTGLGQAGPNTVVPSIAAPVAAFAIGDVTGDGRPDIVTNIRTFGFFNQFDSNDGRTVEKWRLYENRGTAGFKPWTDMELGRSFVSQTVMEDFPSDVMLMDLNGDRFAEMIFTNHYDNKLRIIRFTPLLGPGNLLTTLDNGSGPDEMDVLDYASDLGSPLVGPAMLAKGPMTSTKKVNSIAIGFAGSNTVAWDYNTTRASTKTYEIVGGSETDSDTVGADGANGARTYTAFVGEKITSELTAINNSAADLTDVVHGCRHALDLLARYQFPRTGSELVVCDDQRCQVSAMEGDHSGQ